MAHSLETREKIRQALLGKKHPPERTAKRTGVKRTPEQRKRISEACKGRTPWNKGVKIGNKYPNSGQFKKGFKMPAEVKAKISKAHQGRKRGVEEREKNRQSQYRRFEREIPGYKYDKDGRQNRRKERLRRNGGFHSKSEWIQLKLKHDLTCLSCKKKEPYIQLTKDHIIPLMHGGTDDISNIQPLCRSCNAKKSTKLVENCVNSGEAQNG